METLWERDLRLRLTVAALFLIGALWWQLSLAKPPGGEEQPAASTTAKGKPPGRPPAPKKTNNGVTGASFGKGAV